VAALVFVLVVIGLLALVTVPLMIVSTRRQQAAVPPAVGGRQPLLGSAAQVWVSRGERVLRELTTSLSEQPGFTTLAADASQVVMELRITAGQVAELDHAIARIPVPSLEDEKAALAGSIAEADGSLAEADLVRAHQAVSARLAAAARQRATRDALLAKMQATVMEFERARDELAELITGTTSALSASSDAAADLTSRLDGLREGLVEVRRATDPEIGPAGQGHP
jgi:chromosome segregation ATPase